MIQKTVVSISLFFLISFCVSAQNDSLKINVSDLSQYSLGNKADTVAWVNDKLPLDKSSQANLKQKEIKPFKPDPNKAVLYSAIFPGLGQIYNRKYWKLPIIYGGFMGLYYAVSWNGRYYNDYNDAYRAIMSSNYASPENAKIWGAFVGGSIVDKDNNVNITESQLNSLRTRFRNKKDSFRRYRDLSIIGMVALYGLCMIDAYVDAHLFDFDISPDLSLRVEPKIEQGPFAQKSFGLQCSFTF